MNIFEEQLKERKNMKHNMAILMIKDIVTSRISREKNHWLEVLDKKKAEGNTEK